MVAVSRPNMQRQIFTAEDLERISATGLRYELVMGVLFEMPPAGYQHDLYTNRLAASVTIFNRRTRLRGRFHCRDGVHDNGRP